MALTREKKEEILKELKDWINKSKIIIFVNFHGLSNALSQQLRKLIKESSARYLVAKKTLIKKSLDEFKFSGESPELEGEMALVFGEGEITAPAKTLYVFAKKHSEISLLGGIFEKKFIDREVVLKLANLPSKEVLIAQFINVINSPRQGLVGVLSGAQRDFISVLKQIK